MQVLLILGVLSLMQHHLVASEGAFNGSLRLVSRTHQNEGLLEVYYHGSWGRICSNGWIKGDLTEANVACRQLGYPGALSFNAIAYATTSSNVEILLDDVDCQGNEPSLALCSHSEWGTSNCSSQENIQVVCEDAPDYSTRLAITESENMGPLEISVNGTWRRVIYPQMNELYAGSLFCRNLGYQGARSVQSVAFTALPRVLLDCARTAKTITDCSLEVVQSDEPILVVECLSLMVSAQRNENEGLRTNSFSSLKLKAVSKVKDTSDVLLCGHSWTSSNADVACRQLGFSGFLSASSQENKTLVNSTNYTFEDLNCLGNETGLEECDGGFIASVPCQKYEVAQIACNKPTLKITSLTATSSTTVALSWEITDSTQSYIIQETFLMYSLTRTEFSSSFILNNSAVLIGSLHAYTLYKFKLKALTIFGSMTFSSISRIRTHSDVPASTPEIANIMSPSSSNISLEIKYNGDVDEINGPWKCYVVKYISPNGTVQRKKYADRNQIVFHIDDLLPYTTYNVSIAFQNVRGTGPFSNISTITTQEDSPSEVRDFSVHSPSATSLLLRWNPPLHPNGIITQYDIQYRSVLQDDIVNSTTAASTDRSYTLSGLEEGTRCIIEIRAVTKGGEGQYVTQEVSTLFAAPSGPPADIRVTHSSPTSFSLNWTLPLSRDRNGPISGYLIQYWNLDHPENISNISTTNTSVSFEGLVSYLPYRYRIAALSRFNGSGPFSDNTTDPRPKYPSHVTNLTEVNSNLKWTPPIWKNGDIHNYIVEYVSFKPTQLEQNGTKNVTVSSKESLPNITFETLGLVGGAEYNISVQAENNNGAGPHTNILIKTPIKVPRDPPLNVNVTSPEYDTILVTWQPPAISGQNGPIGTYEICYGIVNCSKEIAHKVDRSHEESLNRNKTFNCSISGLTAGNYSVKVAASTTAGIGPYSAPVFISLEGALSKPPPSEEPLSGSLIAGVTVVVLIIVIAGSVIISIYIYFKWRKIHKLVRKAISKPEKGDHIYEDPKCASRQSGSKYNSVENIYDTCGTPGRHSADDCDDAINEATLKSVSEVVLQSTQTPNFIDNPQYDSYPKSTISVDSLDNPHFNSLQRRAVDVSNPYHGNTLSEAADNTPNDPTAIASSLDSSAHFSLGSDQIVMPAKDRSKPHPRPLQVHMHSSSAPTPSDEDHSRHLQLHPSGYSYSSEPVPTGDVYFLEDLSLEIPEFIDNPEYCSFPMKKISVDSLDNPHSNSLQRKAVDVSKHYHGKTSNDAEGSIVIDPNTLTSSAHFSLGSDQIVMPAKDPSKAHPRPLQVHMHSSSAPTPSDEDHSRHPQLHPSDYSWSSEPSPVKEAELSHKHMLQQHNPGDLPDSHPQEADYSYVHVDRHTYQNTISVHKDIYLSGSSSEESDVEDDYTNIYDVPPNRDNPYAVLIRDGNGTYIQPDEDDNQSAAMDSAQPDSDAEPIARIRSLPVSLNVDTEFADSHKAGSESKC